MFVVLDIVFVCVRLEVKVLSCYPLEKCLKCCNYGYKTERFNEWCRRVTRIQIGEKWIILIEVVCTGVLKIFYSTPTVLSFKKPEVFKYCNYGYKIKPSLMWLFKFRLVLQLTSFVFL